MTVMFSPFRDKNLNPKSWDQKVKFWSEVILEDCVKSNEAVVDVMLLKEKFRRKGKSPSCLETVVQEMIRFVAFQSFLYFSYSQSYIAKLDLFLWLNISDQI
jgi:charged multivesicular body protein 7